MACVAAVLGALPQALVPAPIRAGLLGLAALAVLARELGLWRFAVPENARHIDHLLAAAAEQDAQVAAAAGGATYAGEPDPYRHDGEEAPEDDDSSDPRA